MKIHPRIHETHPEIEDADVEYAWENYLVRATREVAEREVRVGFDLKARELEMVGAVSGGEWLVYHAMTPPSTKTRNEVDKAQRRR